ncbi:MAG: hypothetical protein D3910_01295 [Candidatus Electrothrix sp. ATG2]|nr:hypothetical protein [Candidatus Electrothrix sp. ATG2]
MKKISRSSLRMMKGMVEKYPDEMFFLRKYKDEITLKLNNLCSELFGIKPKISEAYMCMESSPEAEGEVFRWIVRCDGPVFIVSLIKDELVYWQYKSIFKRKHHSMPINSGDTPRSLSGFMQEIAVSRPNCAILL